MDVLLKIQLIFQMTALLFQCIFYFNSILILYFNSILLSYKRNPLAALQFNLLLLQPYLVWVEITISGGAQLCRCRVHCPVARHQNTPMDVKHH